MQFIKSKTGIVTIALIATFVFLYLFTGAFGGTFINLTLNSNKSLEDGLVGHWTFDGAYIDSASSTAEILDRSGSGDHGNFIGALGGAMLWSTTTDPTSFNDQAYAIASDGTDVYVAGYCDGCGSVGSSAMYTYKVSGDTGDMLWATTTDSGTSGDILNAVTSDGTDIYVAGYCYGCGTIDEGAYHVYKIDASNGDMLWSTTTDLTANYDIANAIASDGTNLYVTGFCNGCGAIGGNANYTYKIDATNGDMLWSTTTDLTSGDDTATGIASDGTNVYVTGYCNGCGTAGGNANYTYKVDATNGDMLWATTTDPGAGDDRARAITSDGINVYATGRCNGCGDRGEDAHYTYKINGSNGDMLWATTTDLGGSDDEAWGIYSDGEGLYVVGDCWYCGSKGQTANYLYKIDPTNGDMLWATTTDPSVDFDYGRAVTTDSTGIYVTGYCDGCGTLGDDAHYTYKIKNDTVVNEALTMGNIGQGIEFGGGIEEVRVSDDYNTHLAEDFAISFWFNHSSGAEFFGTRDDGNNSSVSIFQTSDDTFHFNVMGENLSYDMSSPEQDQFSNNWNHVVAVRDNNGEAFFYYNGELKASTTTFTVGTISLSSGDDVLSIGAGSYNGHFNGKMDDVRVYNRTLSADEISRLHELGATTHINKTITTNPDLENGLVLHYTFDGPGAVDTSSSTAEIIDRSSEGENGDWQNHATTTAPGVIGQALNFDGGTSESILVSDYYRTHFAEDFTVAFWSNYNSGAEFFGTYSNSGPRVTLYKQGNTLRFQVWSDSNNSDIDYTLSTAEVSEFNNTWHHITFSRDNNGEVNIYYDGDLSKATTTSTTGTISLVNNDTFSIGAGAYNGHFDGQMDDFRVYNRVLSSEEISRLYELGATTKINKTINTNPDLKNGLVGHWTFDGKDINTASNTAEVLDRSGNNNHGDWQDHSTTTKIGKIGQAIKFTGNEERVSIPDSSSIQTIDKDATVSMWIKRDGQNDNEHGTDISALLYKGPWGGNNDVSTAFGVHAHFNNELISVQVGTRRYFGGQSILDNIWYHVVVVVDDIASSTSIYIDGVLDTSTTPMTTEISLDANDIYISDISNRPYGFNGTIDDVRLYNRPLSAEEISRLYELGN